MRGPARNFRGLEVWRVGKEIVLDVYHATRQFPADELYGLVAQMRRAAVSVPSNIAEGFNRHHNREYRQFLYVSLGSCAELETQVEVASELGHMEVSTCKRLLAKLEHEAKMLRNLIKRLNNTRY